MFEYFGGQCSPTITKRRNVRVKRPEFFRDVHCTVLVFANLLHFEFKIGNTGTGSQLTDFNVTKEKKDQTVNKLIPPSNTHRLGGSLFPAWFQGLEESSYCRVVLWFELQIFQTFCIWPIKSQGNKNSQEDNEALSFWRTKTVNSKGMKLSLKDRSFFPEGRMIL